MKIKISRNNIEKIRAAIDAVEGPRATVRTINYQDITDMVSTIEVKLERLLLRKDWVGQVFECNPHGQQFPNCYKGIPKSTQFTIQRFPSGWFLTSVERSRCFPRKIWAVTLNTKKDEIIEHICDNF